MLKPRGTAKEKKMIFSNGLHPVPTFSSSTLLLQYIKVKDPFLILSGVHSPKPIKIDRLYDFINSYISKTYFNSPLALCSTSYSGPEAGLLGFFTRIGDN